MPGSAAQALVTNLVVRSRDLAAEQESLDGLAAWAGSFTPAVSLQPPDGLLIEIGSCLRLHRGFKNLHRPGASRTQRNGLQRQPRLRADAAWRPGCWRWRATKLRSAIRQNLKRPWRVIGEPARSTAGHPGQSGNARCAYPGRLPALSARRRGAPLRPEPAGRDGPRAGPLARGARILRAAAQLYAPSGIAVAGA